MTVRTRAEPQPYAGGRVFHVYPHGFKGQKTEPSFEGLMCAYNYWCAGTDWATSGRPRVRPGDTILVHAGTYRYNRYEYTNNATVNRTVPLDGTYYLTADGTPEMPIAIKAAGDGEVVFDGDGNFALFDVKAADYTYFEGLTFRNAEVAIAAGTQFIAGAKGLTVKKSRFENVGAGIFTNYAGSSQFYIADNTFIGRNDPDAPDWLGGRHVDEVQRASKDRSSRRRWRPTWRSSCTAPGTSWPTTTSRTSTTASTSKPTATRTAPSPRARTSSTARSTRPASTGIARPVAIDFYNNYITNSHDNPIEADGSMHNIRIMRNMLINHPSHAFCNQPTLGGPVYWIRNIAYNLPAGSTRLTNGAAGVLFYNNTILSETTVAAASNIHWRNNLMLGQNAAPAILSVNTFTSYTSSDYNGFRVNPGAKSAFEWSAPPAGRDADFTGPGHDAQTRDAAIHVARRVRGRDGAGSAQRGGGLRRLRQRAPTRRAGRGDACRSCTRRTSSTSGLKPASAAVDRGVPLPTVTDGFAGRAPDLGALEVGQAAPHYGPRK